MAVTCFLGGAQLVLGSLPSRIGEIIFIKSVLAVLLVSTCASATPIFFTYTGTVSSGTVNSVNVSGDAFSLTAVGDTSTVSSPATDDLSINPVTATFTVGALNGTISVSTDWVLNTLIALVGLSSTGSDLLDFIPDASADQTALDTWNEISNIGPFDDSQIVTNGSLPTTIGPINLTISSATFQATLQSGVPEPATAGLAGAALTLLALGRAVTKRRRA